MAAFNLDQVRMNVVRTAKAGVVNQDTLFTFQQEHDVVTAEYTGGGVVKGYLVGKLTGDQLNFRYCQLDTQDNLDGGVSSCRLSRTPDGKIRLVEKFKWESRNESGENVFEELV